MKKARGLAAMALFLCATASSASDKARPVGSNCDLAAPPQDAGEETNHGATFKVYPRAKFITQQYSGCQILWMPDGKKWTEVAAVEIKAGDPVRIWSSSAADSQESSCVYRKGKVVAGNPDNCPAPEHLILKSLAPGCIKRITEALAAGSGAPRPAGCEYE